MHENNQLKRFLPVHVINPQANKERSIETGEELESLIKTLDGQIIDRIIQKLDNPDRNTYVGKGKVLEVAEAVKKHKIDIVVLNNAAKPKQIFNLKKALQKENPNIEVFDRVDLILHIFEKHAKTKEAKLQIELARMRYMGPRIYGMGFEMSRQGGGIGTVGIGETNTELMKRHWDQSIKKVNDDLNKLNEDRQKRIDRRKKDNFKTVSIVGYTNAGKSTLFNNLTGKKVFVKDELFATLDSTIGELYLQDISENIFITDTIGFIRNLPPKLIKAFKSTLLESINADIILHVVDGSDHEVFEKIKVVEEILDELGIDRNIVLSVFNKTDKLSDGQVEELRYKFKDYSPIFISAKNDKGIENIINLLSEKIKNNFNDLHHKKS